MGASESATTAWATALGHHVDVETAIPFDAEKSAWSSSQDQGGKATLAHATFV